MCGAWWQSATNIERDRFWGNNKQVLCFLCLLALCLLHTASAGILMTSSVWIAVYLQGPLNRWIDTFVAIVIWVRVIDCQHSIGLFSKVIIRSWVGFQFSVFSFRFWLLAILVSVLNSGHPKIDIWSSRSLQHNGVHGWYLRYCNASLGVGFVRAINCQ